MIGSISLSIAVFVVGVALAVANRRKKVGDTLTFLAVFLTPLFVLGVASDKIKEFTGPAGLSAKFNEIANAKVAVTPVQKISFETPTPVEKTNINLFEQKRANILPGTPVIFTFTLGKGTYVLDVAKQELRELLLTNPDTLVVINDSAGAFVAMADPSKFYTLLNDPSKGPLLIQSIKENQTLPYYKEVLVFDSLKEDETSNAVALEKMLLHDLRIMAVTDKQNSVHHIARRDQIIADLVNQLVSN